MTIGFYFECQKRSGGVYQYALNILASLREMREHRFIVFNISPDFPFDEFRLSNWSIINLIPIAQKSAPSAKTETPQQKEVRYYAFKRRLSLLIISFLRVLHLYSLEAFFAQQKSKMRARAFDGKGIDLMLFHGPSELSFLTKIPSIVPVHDIHHKLHPESPELSDIGQFKKRELQIEQIKKHAYKIITNSPVVRKDLIRLYGIPAERVESVPCPPPLYMHAKIEPDARIRVQQKYHIPDKFLFYPAQFWPHKNHRGLIEAMKILKDAGLTPNLVLVGSNQPLWGEYERVQKLSSQYGLEGQIHILGYVENEEMPVLYSMAEAMVMPTLFGFTYPVFEAWLAGCPVIYSNDRTSREQAGDAALLVDPHNPADIADKIKRILEDKALRKDLIQKGLANAARNSSEKLTAKIRELFTTFEKERRARTR